MAPMQVDESLHHGEADAEPSVPPAGAAFLLAEHVEDVRQELRVDAFTGVGDSHDRRVVTLFERHEYPSADRSEFHGVRQHVDEHLLEPARIAFDPQRLERIDEFDCRLSCARLFRRSSPAPSAEDSRDRESRDRA
jgi:hypothetical protein